MRAFWVSFIVVALAGNAAVAKDVYVDGYTRKDGTYVAPYHRTSPDSSPSNNYSSYGNVNPYTGEPGTRDPYPSYGAPRGYGDNYRAPQRGTGESLGYPSQPLGAPSQPFGGPAQTFGSPNGALRPY